MSILAAASSPSRKRLLVVGLGGIGALFSSRFDAGGHAEIVAVCRSNYEAVKARGFEIRSVKWGNYTFNPAGVVSSVSQAQGNFDFIGKQLSLSKSPIYL